MQYKNGSYECNISNLKLIQYSTKHDDTYSYYEFKVSQLKHPLIIVLVVD